MQIEDILTKGNSTPARGITFGEEFNFVLTKPMVENDNLDVYAESYFDMVKARIEDIFKGNILESVAKYGTIPGDIRKARYDVEKLVSNDKFDNNENVVIGMPYGLQDRIDIVSKSLTALPKMMKQALADTEDVKERLNFYIHNKNVRGFSMGFKKIKPIPFEVKLSESTDTQTTVGRLFGNAHQMVLTYRTLNDITHNINVEDIKKLGALSDEIREVLTIIESIEKEAVDENGAEKKEVLSTLTDNIVILSRNVEVVGKYAFMVYALSESLVDLVNSVRDW